MMPEWKIGVTGKNLYDTLSRLDFKQIVHRSFIQITQTHVCTHMDSGILSNKVSFIVQHKHLIISNFVLGSIVGT